MKTLRRVEDRQFDNGGKKKKGKPTMRRYINRKEGS